MIHRNQRSATRHNGGGAVGAHLPGKSLRRTGAALLLFGPTILFGAAMPAGADHPAGTGSVSACGTTISSSGSYALHADLTNCPADGVSITADNVTLDLNGHKIIGDGDVGAAPGDVGIRLGIETNGVTGVTITDSSAKDATTGLRSNQVAAFNAGVAVLGASSNNTVQNLNVTGNVGTGGDYGDGIVVKNSGGTSLSNGNKVKSRLQGSPN